MGRSPREEVPNGYYHVHTRGNNRRRIFFGNWSGRLFVHELERTAARHCWRVLAWCLMDNHYHLVLQIRDGGLSNGVCELNGRFAKQTNKTSKRSNHLFGQRFTSWLIEDESYLFECIRYALLNPVRADRVEDPRTWRFSSMRGMLGNVEVPSCVDVPWVLEHFDSDPRRAPKTFLRFVLDGIGLPPPPVPGAGRKGVTSTSRE